MVFALMNPTYIPHGITARLGHMERSLFFSSPCGFGVDI